jgi:hypothetical protein
MENPLTQLHQFIDKHYDLEELRTLCFELGVDYDALRGEGTAAKARELVLYLGRRGHLAALLQRLRAGRPEAFAQAGFSPDAATLEMLYAGLPAFEDGASSVHQHAEGHHIAQADRGGTAVVASEGASVTVTVQGESLREKELAYLDRLLAHYEYWRDHYTPLAGIAEVRAAVKDGPRLDLPTPFTPAGFEKLMEHGYGEQSEIRREPVGDLRTAVAQHRRIILLGDPGSGKTTTLWRLAYDYAQSAQDNDQAPLPVLVPLGGYTDDGPFEPYLARHLGPLAPFLQNYRSSERLVLLLDGLNEMPQTGYAERVKRIRDALGQYPDEMAVVTCRALDYVVELERMQKVKVSPLDEGRIQIFLHNYLGETAGERLFRVMTKEMPPLLALGRNPYMLLMTAQVYAGAGGKLPTNRAHLLAAFVDTLLGREEKRHTERWIEAERQKEGLAALAYAIQVERGAGTTVEREWAMTQLGQAVPGCDVERLLYLATSATLLDANDANVRFHHQLLQESFAARYVVDSAVTGTISDLLSHCTDERWRETTLMTAGLLDNANDFFVVFRQALDNLIREDKGIVTFLTWVARKSAAISTASSYSPATLRSYYCFHNFDPYLGSPLGNLACDLVPAQVLTFIFYLNLGLEPVFGRQIVSKHIQDIDLDLNPGLVLDIALTIVLDIARDRAFSRFPFRTQEHALAQALVQALSVYMAQAVVASQKVGPQVLHQELAALTVPTAVALQEDWNVFATKLKRLMITYCDIGHDWDFTEDQNKLLARYFYATELLAQCLDVANVSDRAAIEDRLLLPPGWDETQAASHEEVQP